MEELQKIVALIRECANPDKIILAGKYAGMSLSSVMGGYELLVVSPQNPSVKPSEIERYINKHLPPSQRQEKRVFVYTVAYRHLAEGIHHHYFYQRIDEEALLLYDATPSLSWQSGELKIGKAYKASRHNMEQCLGLGKIFMQDAEAACQAQSARTASFYIYQAIRQYLWGIVLVYYGFEIREEHPLYSTYSLARHTSEKLAALWNLDTLQGRFALMKLHNLNHRSRYSRNFSIPAEKLSKYLEITHIIAQEAEKVCQQRVDLLKGLSPKEGTIGE